MKKNKLIYNLFIKQRRSIIQKYFDGIEYATMDYNKKVYNTWRLEFQTNIGIAFGAIGAILSIVSIIITLL